MSPDRDIPNFALLSKLTFGHSPYESRMRRLIPLRTMRTALRASETLMMDRQITPLPNLLLAKGRPPHLAEQSRGGPASAKRFVYYRSEPLL